MHASIYRAPAALGVLLFPLCAQAESAALLVAAWCGVRTWLILGPPNAVFGLRVA